MRRTVVSRKWIIVALVLAVIILALYQGLRDRTYLRQEDVISDIESHLPTGSSVADVESFVSKYKTDFPISLGSYHKIEPRMRNDTNIREGPPNADGYLPARIDRTGRWQLFEVFMTLNFYFDEDKKMIGFRVSSYADAF